MWKNANKSSQQNSTKILLCICVIFFRCIVGWTFDEKINASEIFSYNISIKNKKKNILNKSQAKRERFARILLFSIFILLIKKKIYIKLNWNKERKNSIFFLITLMIIAIIKDYLIYLAKASSEIFLMTRPNKKNELKVFFRK